MSEPAMYSKVSSLMTSMMGQTTAFLQWFQLILPRGVTYLVLDYSGRNKQAISFPCLGSKRNTHNPPVITLYKSYTTPCPENANCCELYPKGTDYDHFKSNYSHSITPDITLHLYLFIWQILLFKATSNCAEQS